MYHFTDDCLIGVEEIDNEHRELFRIINETQDLLDNQIISCLLYTSPSPRDS